MLSFRAPVGLIIVPHSGIAPPEKAINTVAVVHALPEKWVFGEHQQSSMLEACLLKLLRELDVFAEAEHLLGMLSAARIL